MASLSSSQATAPKTKVRSLRGGTGSLEEDPAACGHLVVRLTPEAELEGRPMSKQESSLLKQLQGDKPYSSSTLPLLELNPAVSALELQFIGAGCAPK